ncbi:MAG: hypothetical protein R3192_03790 [Woeseiaceae bacterium]|nr:hypothetical protein [Woeseiaceae bacterium]
MLTEAEPRELELGANQDDLHNKEGLLHKKIWLPKFVYDGLPYFYLTAGFAAFFATLYINAWFWILPHYLLFSAACLHLGFAVRRRRANARRADEQE